MIKRDVAFYYEIENVLHIVGTYGKAHPGKWLWFVVFIHTFGSLYVLQDVLCL